MIIRQVRVFVFFVLTFEPIITETCEPPQNDHQNLNFVDDNHTYGK